MHRMLVFNAKLLSHEHIMFILQMYVACVYLTDAHLFVCLIDLQECLKLAGIQTLFLQICIMMIVEQDLHT